MYEHKSEKLLSRFLFFIRMLRHCLVGLALMGTALCIGIAGYHFTEKISWLDSLLNAAMILGGMGPVTELHTNAGKLFAAAYALFSGVMFLVIAGIIVAPLAHRLIHRLHLPEA